MEDPFLFTFPMYAVLRCAAPLEDGTTPLSEIVRVDSAGRNCFALFTDKDSAETFAETFIAPAKHKLLPLIDIPALVAFPRSNPPEGPAFVVLDVYRDGLKARAFSIEAILRAYGSQGV